MFRAFLIQKIKIISAKDRFNFRLAADMSFRFYILSVFVILTVRLKSQDPYIFSNDPYSGISAVGISPTQPFLNPNQWDLNLISEDVFIQNRYGYISKSSLLGLAGGDVKEADIKHGITGENTKKVWDYYNHDQTGFHFSSELMGPSFSFNFKLGERNFSAGLFSKLRTQTSIVKVDNYLKYTNQQIDEPVLYNLGAFETSFMNWTEIGLNLSADIFQSSENFWVVGVNLKYLSGNDAYTIKNRKNALMRREFVPDPEDSTRNIKNLYVSNFDVEAAYSTGYDFENDRYKYKKNGKGFGVDIGMAVVDFGEYDQAYNFKMGLNLLDVGSVTFDGFVHRFIGDDFQYTNNPALEVEFENPEQFAQIISQEIYGNPEQSLISNEFKIGLPTALHFNVSKSISAEQYLSLDWIQRTPIFENSLRRSNIINLSYLYSIHKMAYGFSISAYEYQNLQFGAFFRFGPLIIGSENVLPMLIPHKKLHGADFYFGLKIYPFRNRDMERRSREKCKY